MPRPRFKATAEHRHMIESMAAIGTPVDRIATLVGERGIDPKTLRKYFAMELERGSARGESALRQKRYQLAMAGNTAMLKDALQDIKSKRTRWDQQNGTAPLEPGDVRARLANLLEKRHAGRKEQQDSTAAAVQSLKLPNEQVSSSGADTRPVSTVDPTIGGSTPMPD